MYLFEKKKKEGRESLGARNRVKAGIQWAKLKGLPSSGPLLLCTLGDKIQERLRFRL